MFTSRRISYWILLRCLLVTFRCLFTFMVYGYILSWFVCVFFVMYWILFYVTVYLCLLKKKNGLCFLLRLCLWFVSLFVEFKNKRFHVDAVHTGGFFVQDQSTNQQYLTVIKWTVKNWNEWLTVHAFLNWTKHGHNTCFLVEFKHTLSICSCTCCFCLWRAWSDVLAF